MTNSNETINDLANKAIANKFNKCVTNIGPSLAENINNSSDTNSEKYLTGNYQNSMFLVPITDSELKNEIRNMDPLNYDNISNKIVKSAAKKISKPLTHIFISKFQTGVIPEKLKLAIVTPIFKAGEKNKFENYRPISVLSCFSKLLEKLMYKRLIDFIDKNQILLKHQHGFRKNRSTELAISELVDKITKGVNQEKYLSKYLTQLITEF